MAAKIKILKYSKDARFVHRAPLERAPGSLNGLYLLALRSHAAQTQSVLPKRKLTVSIDPSTGEDGHPLRVHIKHA